MTMTTTTSSSSPHTPASITGYYRKKFEGITVNEPLLSLWKEVYSQIEFGNNNSDSQKEVVDDEQVSSSPSLPPSLQPWNKKKSLQILKNGPHPNRDPQWISIDVLQAIQTLLLLSKKNANELEEALNGTSATRTSLVFTPPPQADPDIEETKEQRKFRERMGRLRLQYEETKYMKLTTNLHQLKDQDEITAKSMSYAASVGLNMIIAPLSFGCFMYFFAGGMFDYFLGEELNAKNRTTGGTDIKRVIVGVISGVVMLFIEMILFVIRTHELEAHTRKKKRKQKAVQPFGVYSKLIVDSDNDMANTKNRNNHVAPKVKQGVEKKQD